ncbi:sensor histidine kinase [Colwellia psychrerythraea]|uniref:histidine kinase n=1 Tax=Colwellia psychrerythraea TaxID=28229 RepID=A0A099KEL7_COLPS|nr:ATP-binding protein [Colwellia psychrerythraea]KGJ88811.1 ATP-binding region ATPase domain protein [Colwellia psychrerythraea]
MLIVQLILINIAFIISYSLLLPSSPWLFSIISILLIALAVMRYQYYHRQSHQILQTLLHGLRNLQDGDFSITLANNKSNKSHSQAEVLALFNQVTDKLRQEKQSLYQRELLLDKVVNASDVVTVLVNHRDTIIFANRAAEYFFAQTSMLGMSWQKLLTEHMPELGQHEDKGNAIIQLMLAEPQYGSGYSSFGADDTQYSDADANTKVKSEQSWHLSRHHLKLHGSRHQLTLLKPITQAMHQQELQTWKKVIRVINHELNNSIAPISSMCHSGNILAERLAEPQLTRVFTTISKRINKLAEFIQSYSQLARLSRPQKQTFDLMKTLVQLQNLYHFTLCSDDKSLMFSGDESQIEQLLINLLKNAQQACSTQKTVQPTEVSIKKQQGQLCITVRDFGTGMPVDILPKAFLPYYSTKADGSGIGLSICREIIDGHHGQITLNNHPQGGLQVLVWLPLDI